jgi:hypothetical protein
LIAADLAELQPELWITLIDSPQSIEDRLRTHKAEYFHLDLWDIVRWQELEVFFSHHLASDLRVRHYVVPVTQPEVLSALASGPHKPTAYASYPMSHAPASTQRKIRDFINRLKDYYIVFDPESVNSDVGIKQHHTTKDRRALGSHTIVRDLDWFIRINADTVVAYWPEVVFSSGMSDELRYAFEIGRYTILVTEREEQGKVPLLSPFLTYKATVFWSSDEFFSFLALPEMQRKIYSLCQDVMAEEFRAHTSGAFELSSDVFQRECKRVAEYRLGLEFGAVDLDQVEQVAVLVYNSWAPLLQGS